MNSEAIYAKLPLWMQEVAINLVGWNVQRRRYGAAYEAVEKEIFRRGEFSSGELRVWQTAQLSQHLRVGSSVPYWSERFKDYGINLDGDPWEEYAKFPILTKSEVVENTGRLVNRGLEGQLLKGKTSGTTGAGLVFYETQRCEQERWATWWRYRSWHGIHRGLGCAYFGGRSVVPLTQTEPPYWRWVSSSSQLIFSSYHLNEATANLYLEALRDRSLVWIHGYPSVLSLFASLVGQSARKLGIKYITTGAESLLESQREKVEAAFGARVIEHYGQAESVANISQDLEGRLVVDEDFGLTEFESVGGGEYRIIGTNWLNPGFPLFRYEVGDIATLCEHRPMPDGSPRYIEAIDGRREDYILLHDGTAIGRLDHILKDFVEIREAQIYQRKRGEIEFRVVQGADYSDATESRLLKSSRKRLGDDILISIRYFDCLERTKTGKLRFVISELGEGKLK